MALIDVSGQVEASPQVLVVDDEQMNIEVVQLMLQNKGIEIDFALSGKSALQLVKQRLV